MDVLGDTREMTDLGGAAGPERPSDAGGPGERDEATSTSGRSGASGTRVSGVACWITNL